MFLKPTITSAVIGALTLIPGLGQAEMLKVEGGEIFYETVGEGPMIMVMHGGLGLDHTYLRPYFDQLSDIAQVVYLDHMGNGKSSRPDDFSTITFASMTADADALRTHLGADTMILIGHSWGGFLAQEHALAYPETLSGLVLVDTVPVFDYAPTLSGTEAQMAALGALFSAPTTDDANMRALWNTVIPMYFHAPDQALLDRLDAGTTYSSAAWNNAGGLMATFNTLEGLAGLQVPTLAMAGAHDGITPPEPGAKRLAATLPNAEAILFENSAHYPFIEEEAAFFAALRGWIGGL